MCCHRIKVWHLQCTDKDWRSEPLYVDGGRVFVDFASGELIEELEVGAASFLAISSKGFAAMR